MPSEGGVLLPPMTDHTQRRVVMPSPDLLYAICSYDLATRPLRLRADPKLPTYWSIALYAANSDNFFVLNDRQAGGQPVDLLLVGPGGATPPDLAKGTRVVATPSARGLVLMRVLVPLLGKGRLVASRSVPTAVLVAVTDEETRPAAVEVAAQLRSRGIPTEVSPGADRFGKQIRHADRRGIPFVWFGGADGEVKDIRSGDQVPASAADWAPPAADLTVGVTGQWQ